jgi:hypothetical protein
MRWLKKRSPIQMKLLTIIVAQDLPLLPETISVLGNCKDSRAAHLIVGWLKRTNKNYSSDNDAIEALGKIGGEEQPLILRRLLHKKVITMLNLTL